MCDECCCGPHDHHDHHGHHHHRHEHGGWDRGPDRGPPRDWDRCDCGCQDEEGHEEELGFERRFVSKAEMLEAFEWYLKELQNEAQGVREAIVELKAEIAQIEADEKAMEKPKAAPGKARRARKAAAKAAG